LMRVWYHGDCCSYLKTINWNVFIGKRWGNLPLILITYRLASMYTAWLALPGVRLLLLELLWQLMLPV